MDKPDTSSIDYKYGIFAHIGNEYKQNGRYWTNKQIKYWMDLNNVF